MKTLTSPQKNKSLSKKAPTEKNKVHSKKEQTQEKVNGNHTTVIEQPQNHALDREHFTHQDMADFMAIKKHQSENDQNYSRLFFSLGLVLSLLIVITAFEWKFYDNGSMVDLNMDNVDHFEDLFEIPQTDQPPPPPPEQVIAPVFKEVSDEEIIEEVQVDLDVELTEDMTIAPTEFEDVVMEEPEEEEAEEIFTIVEETPTPVGGYPAFYKFVSENLNYPFQAREARIEGRVYVQFVVRSDGQITDVRVVKGIGGGCDEEAKRVVEMAPNWNPGKQRGRPVNVQMVMPITFVLK